MVLILLDSFKKLSIYMLTKGYSGGAQTVLTLKVMQEVTVNIFALLE